jgi:hypothetical protein
MRSLHIVSAVIEALAGAALLSVPSAGIALLLGTPLDTPASVAVGRLAGAALLALGVACWLAHYDAHGRAARGLSVAMTVYNLGAVVILTAAGCLSQPVGVLLWPAVALHAAMTVWCAISVKCGSKAGVPR